MIHPLGGVLSAYGMGLADRRAVRERTLALPLDDAGADALTAAIADLGEQARADLPEAERSETVLRLRYDGTDSLFDVMLGDRAAMLAEFEAQYQARFGYGGTGTVLVDMVRVEAIAPTAEDMGKVATIATQKAAPLAQVMLAGTPAPVFDRAGLTLDSAIDGPALISDPVSTTVVEPGWRARLDLIGNLLLTRHAPRPAPAADDGTAVDPVRLEVMGGLFMAIAEEMGAALQHSASSVNIPSGWISPAPCSMPPAIWSPMRRTCRFTWAAWAKASARSCAGAGSVPMAGRSTGAACCRATSMRSMLLMMAARTCPT
jgi:5-oxoprolinase (ATP-hydrolysing)